MLRQLQKLCQDIFSALKAQIIYHDIKLLVTTTLVSEQIPWPLKENLNVWKSIFEFIIFQTVRSLEPIPVSNLHFLFVKMSKQQILVPNLNEIMAEYGENTEVTVADIVKKVPEKELQKEMGREEVEEDKRRKMKRRENEEE